MGFGVLIAMKNGVVVIKVIISCSMSSKYQRFRAILPQSSETKVSA